ncbi:ArsR family transcriptional regulator [Methylophaga sulfidovorans]|uniref:ArsR family transcriptional regulator n=2 Tax=Methylophaga sulfidovorans TaxID=45496 RepID=A0A1I3WF60_9GAMM|nr:ArsR family transcriptional regulator [Methylophaga sulfidovorans]
MSLRIDAVYYMVFCDEIQSRVLTGKIVAQALNIDSIAIDNDIERAAFALKAMSHPLRLKILCAIGENELSVQDIVEQVGTTQSNVSQHLAKLREKEILMSRRDANRIYYRVNDERTLRLIEMMREVFCSAKN